MFWQDNNNIIVTNFFVAKKTKNARDFKTKKTTKKLKKSFKKVLTKQNDCGTIKNVLGFETKRTKYIEK